MNIQKLLLLAAIVVAKADTGYFLQVSDIHYDPMYKEGAPANCYIGTKTGLRCCRSFDVGMEPYRDAGYWGDYGCDAPFTLVNGTLEWISDNLDINFVVWTGDTVGHNDLTQSLSKNMKAVDQVTDLFIAYFGDVPVFPVVGNHDTWPIDQLSVPTNKVLDHLSDTWSIWLDPGAIDTVKNGGYYSQLLFAGSKLRFLVLNCLYDDTNNKLVWSDDPAGQHEWLAQELTDAEDFGEKVWIIGHIYPGGSESSDEFTQTMLDLVADYSDTVINQFWGHSHKDDFTLTWNGESFVGHSYIVPSLVPDKHYPSFRVYEYDTNTLEIVDYHQYVSTIIDDPVESNELEYSVLYSAKDTFGLDDMTTDSWAGLVDRMANDSDLFNYYWTYRSPGTEPASCGDSCRKMYLCKIKFQDPDEYSSCNKS